MKHKLPAVLVVFMSLCILIGLFMLKSGQKSVPTEHILKVHQALDLANFDGQVFKISLDSIDFPKTQVPGNRPIYHLTIVTNNQSEKITFDPNNSGKMISYFGIDFQIMSNDGDGLKVVF